MSNNERKIIFHGIINVIENKLEILTSRPIISLILIGIFGLLLRLMIFEPEIPIRQDANAYFWYAIDMKMLQNFPPSGHTNDGWPMVLSIFFSFFNYNNYIDLTALQRVVTIGFSIATIIPFYFLCRKFFNSTYSLVGIAIFTFEPHIVQNSTLGLTEPLYIFLIVLSCLLLLSNNQKLFFSSFVITGLATIVRAEAALFLFIFLIVLTIRNGKNKKTVKKVCVALIAFSLIFLPMMYVKTETSGNPSTALYIAEFSVASAINPEERGVNFSSLVKGVETLVKKLGQSMIPYFAMFVPFGIILAFQKRDKNNILILLTLGIYTLVSIRMFMAVQDLRLFLILMPFFSIFSIYTIQYISEKIDLKQIFLILILASLLLLSWFFLYSTINLEYEKEAVDFANYIVKNVPVSNNYYPESGYVYGVWASSELEFPIFSTSVDYSGPKLLDYYENSFRYLKEENSSVEEYVLAARTQGLTHLIVDGNDNAEYFNDVYFNDKNYPYLIKEFDSIKENYKHFHVKVYQINYNIFDNFINMEKTN